jgi:hypothetical protein
MAGTLANIKVEPCTVTWNSVDLGYTEGDIEVAFEETLVDVTAHQTGSLILDAIRTGARVSEISITLKEVSAANIEAILVAGPGAANTPGAGTEVLGYGYNQQFSSVLGDCQKLILHPVSVASGTLTRDWAVWKAYPRLDSITFSAENPQTMTISFLVYPDTTKIAGLQFMVYGDHTQELDA